MSTVGQEAQVARAELPGAAQKEFQYKGRLGLFAASLLGAIGSAGGFTFIALANDRGLVLLRAFRFSMDEATMFYWGCALIGAAATVYFIAVLATWRRSTRRLLLTDTYLLAPSSPWTLSTYEQIISYRKIQRVQLIDDGDSMALHISHSAEEMLRIEETRMTSRDEFLTFAKSLQECIENRLRPVIPGHDRQAIDREN